MLEVRSWCRMFFLSCSGAWRFENGAQIPRWAERDRQAQLQRSSLDSRFCKMTSVAGKIRGLSKTLRAYTPKSEALGELT